MIVSFLYFTAECDFGGGGVEIDYGQGNHATTLCFVLITKTGWTSKEKAVDAGWKVASSAMMVAFCQLTLLSWCSPLAMMRKLLHGETPHPPPSPPPSEKEPANPRMQINTCKFRLIYMFSFCKHTLVVWVFRQDVFIAT